MSNDKGPGLGWLGDLINGILPDDGLYIGRSKTVPGGQQGWGNLWKANGSLHSHQKVVEHFGNMISSPSGKWLRWRLHEVKSKIPHCHCRPSQPCHGDAIVRAFAEAMAEEKHRGGAPPRLDGFTLCGWDGMKKPSLLVPSAMQEMLKGCSTFLRGKYSVTFFPFRCRATPPKQRERAFHDRSAR